MSADSEDDKSFATHIAREGARIAKTVREEAIELQAGQAANAQEDLLAKDAQALDRLDEIQLVEELTGRIVPEYFYEYSTGGRTITGVSQAGIKAVVREMSRRGEALSVEHVEFEEGEDENGPWVGCLATVRNLRSGEIRFGYAAQSRKMKLRSGTIISDPFAKIKALNKGQRNGVRAFVPEVVLIAMFREWKAARNPEAAKR